MELEDKIVFEWFDAIHFSSFNVKVIGGAIQQVRDCQGLAPRGGKWMIGAIGYEKRTLKNESGHPVYKMRVVLEVLR